MADWNTPKLGFFASLAKLGRSLADLGRAFEGKSPVSVTNLPAQADPNWTRVCRSLCPRPSSIRKTRNCSRSTPPAGTSRTKRDCLFLRMRR